MKLEIGDNLDAIHDTSILVGYMRGYYGLGQYADYKRLAIQYRQAGDISGALVAESRCDEIYRSLPDWAKTW